MVVHLSAERGQTSSSFLVRRITDRSLGAAKESLRFRDVVSGSVGLTSASMLHETAWYPQHSATKRAAPA